MAWPRSRFLLDSCLTPNRVRRPFLRIDAGKAGGYRYCGGLIMVNTFHDVWMSLNKGE
jgi:hypothetical protein